LQADPLTAGCFLAVNVSFKQIFMTFEELGLNGDLLKAVTDLGFETPTPIQQQTIPLLNKELTDIVALAQTGTGKTAAFGLPILEKINVDEKKVQALILAPTRELCVQITNDMKNYGKYMRGFSITAVYGGSSIENQIRDIKRGVQVIAATPGRLLDLIERRAVNLNTINIVVLDEADEMLNMGFKDSIDAILSETPQEKYTWLFSATMPKEVERIARTYMNKPVELTSGKKNEGAANIKHVYYVVNPRERYLALKRVADFYPEIFGIVFCRTRAETQEVAESLIRDGYSADALHGDLSQAQRDFVMKRFRNRTLQMLVATDVAARGIDIDSITHVINYNLPEDVENYTHRSGRTGRAGKSGISMAIVSPKETGKIKDIERILKTKFEKLDVPTGVDVCEKQLFHLVHKLHDVEVKDEEIEKFLPKIYDELKDLSKEELIKRVISEEFNRFYNYYQNAPDLNMGKDGKGTVEGAFGNGRTTRFFVNMGSMDGFNPNSIKDFLVDMVKLHPRMVFNIDVKDSFSFFETESKFVDNFIALNAQDIEFNSRKVSLEVSHRKMRDSGDGERRSGGERRGGGGDYKSGGRSSSGYKGGGDRRDSGAKRPRKPGGFSSEKPAYGGEKTGEKKRSFGKSRF